MTSGFTGRTATEMRERATAWHDQQEIVTSCLHCEWRYVGTAFEGRELSKGHRRVHHPDVKQTRRRRGSLQRFNLGDQTYRDEGNQNAAEVANMLTRAEKRVA